jgi:hypothetical protein
MWSWSCSQQKSTAFAFRVTNTGRNPMSKSKAKPYRPALAKLMSEKTKVLSQAQAFAQMGLAQTAQPLWQTAGSLEERIAPRLDAIGRNREAAVHRISSMPPELARGMSS